ncbi:MAG: SUMF1/EgtB/PvdO family nonheme iron enzyme, partial [Bacteroidales bacterium]
MNRKCYLIFVLVLIPFLLLFSGLQGNNISVNYDYLTGQNTTDGYTYIQFDICWENSWRRDNQNQNDYGAPYNWDAAWVFVKYRVNNASLNPESWKHASLSATQSEHNYPADALVKPASDHTGVFIYSNNNQVGDVNYDDIQLRWEYADDGVSDNDEVEIKVFAIEMVYIPEGSFYVGNDGNEVDKFTKTEITSASMAPSGKNIGASFPNGYNALYMMKYEVTQEQYADFLNSLISTEATSRYSASSSGNRYGITESGGVYSTTNRNVACNFISDPDAQAYAAFAGLRPMTEMEYEK